MVLGLTIDMLYDGYPLDGSPVHYRWGSNILETTNILAQTFKIDASDTDELVTLLQVDENTTKFVVIEDLSGGDTLTFKLNGGSTALSAKPHCILTQDITSISFSNSDADNPVYVRVIRGVIGSGTEAFSVPGEGTTAITSIVTITTDTVLTTSNRTVLIDATLANVTATLPSAASMTGRTLTIIRIDSSSFAALIAGGTINGVSGYELSAQEAIEITSDGTGWYIS
jgi:hypothetical protein